MEVFCQTVAQQQQIAAAIKESETGGERWIELVRLHLSVVKLIAHLAGGLRLTPRSSINRTTPKLASQSSRPWDPEDAE